MAVRVRVRVDRAQADRVARRSGTRLVTLATVRTHARTNVLTPVNTGNLRARNQMKVRSGSRRVRGVVWNSTRYAMSVHDGARPHIIRPRRKQALWWEGLDHPVAMVRHPGVRARPFMATALRGACTPLGFRVMT